MGEQVFTVTAATINLYRIDGDGEVVQPAVWLGACAEGLKLAYRFDKVVSRPTGAPYPKVHHVNEEHEIAIDRVWVIDGEDFEMERNQRYVMQIVWTDPNDGADGTHTRTYYGVTNNSADLNSQEHFELRQNQVFNAEYYVAETEEAA